MKRCHLFSNVRRPLKDFDGAVRSYAQENIGPDDVVMCLNKAIALPVLHKYAPSARFIVLTRVDNGAVVKPVPGGALTRHGFGEKELLEAPYASTIEVKRIDDDGTVVSLPDAAVEMTVHVPGYPQGFVPTTGMFAIHYLRLLFTQGLDEFLTLVNFYASDDNSTEKWCGHAWEWEDSYVRSLRREFL